MRLNHWATICFALLATGCASQPAVFETDRTVARVVGREVAREGRPGESRTTVSFMLGGAFVPVEVPVRGADVFSYALRSESGLVIVTQSTVKQDVGACVQLRHPPLAEPIGGEYNFIAGTLQPSRDCSPVSAGQD